MYPEELSADVEPSRPRDEQLAHAVTHALTQELADSVRMVRHCLEQLTADQSWWRAADSLNSIGNLVLHLSGNLRQWIVSGLGGAADLRDRPGEFAERGPMPNESLVALMEQTVREAKSVLGRLDSRALLSRRRIQGFDVTGLAAACHSVAHFRGHTQEIIGLTRQQLGSQYRFAWTPTNSEQGA